MRAFPTSIRSRIRLMVRARKGISGNKKLREGTNLLFAMRDVSERVLVEDMSIYVLVLSDFIPFFVETLLFCVCLKPMQNKS